MQIISLQADLEEARLNEKQLKHKLEVQTETLNHKMDELRSLNEQKQDTISSELMEMHQNRMELESVKVARRTVSCLSIVPLVMLVKTQFPLCVPRPNWLRRCRRPTTKSSSWSSPTGA